MDVFYYDSDGPNRRSWKSILGSCNQCDWDRTQKRFVTMSGAPIHRAIFVAHYSALLNCAIEESDLMDFSRTHPSCTTIVVSGGSRKWVPVLSNFYFRRANVGLDPADPFGACFDKFRREIENTGNCIFELLDPPLTPVLTGLAILFQLYIVYRFANGTIGIECPLSQSLGLSGLQSEAASRLKLKLAGSWPQSLGDKWWAVSLGVRTDERGELDESEYVDLLVRFCREIGLLALDDTQLGSTYYARAESLELLELLRMDARPIGRTVVALMEGSEIDTQLLTEAWDDLKGLLSV